MEKGKIVDFSFAHSIQICLYLPHLNLRVYDVWKTVLLLIQIGVEVGGLT